MVVVLIVMIGKALAAQVAIVYSWQFLVLQPTSMWTFVMLK